MIEEILANLARSERGRIEEIEENSDPPNLIREVERIGKENCWRVIGANNRSRYRKCETREQAIKYMRITSEREYVLVHELKGE